MKIVWDETKRYQNLRKHGIDFLDCHLVLAGFTLTIEDEGLDYGEQRFITFGVLEGRVVSVVHAEWESEIRVISMRKATRHEQKNFFQNLPD